MSELEQYTAMAREQMQEVYRDAVARQQPDERHRGMSAVLDWVLDNADLIATLAALTQAEADTLDLVGTEPCS